MDISFYVLLVVACLVLLLAMWACAGSSTQKWGPDLTLELPPHLLQEALFGQKKKLSTATTGLKRCEMYGHLLNWKPVRTLKSIRKFYTSAVGYTILEANKNWIRHPSKEHLELLVTKLLSTSDACQEFLFLIGQHYFSGEQFTWCTLRIFLAFMGEVAAFAMRKGRVLLIDDIILSTALYIKDYLMESIEGCGGWLAFQMDCVRCVFHQTLWSQANNDFENSPSPSAPSELPCDPLLSNEHPVSLSSPPPRFYGQQHPVFLNTDSPVQVLPSHYKPNHKLRPVFSTFKMEEPA